MPASAPSPAIAVAHAGVSEPVAPGNCAKEGSSGSAASPVGRRPLQRWRGAASSATQQLRQQLGASGCAFCKSAFVLGDGPRHAIFECVCDHVDPG
jgi:hypothetical protein